MPNGKPLEEIISDLSTNMTDRANEVDANFKALQEEQARIFSKTVQDLELVLKSNANDAQDRIKRHAESRLERSIEDIKRRAEQASKQMRNVLAVVAALLFAGTLIFLNEQREKATEKTIEFQNELIAAHTSVDTSVENLRADVRDSESKMKDIKAALAAADEQLTEKQKQLDEASRSLQRAQSEYEDLANRIKHQAK